MSETILIRPRIAPRGSRDLRRSILPSVVVLAQIVALPLLVGSLIHLSTRSAKWALVGGYVVFLALALYVGLQSVGWLKLDSAGITFGRRIGTPGRLRWDRITGIRPATPSEVIRQGWLWPALRPREATRCLSPDGHYRIEWDRQFCFFPPEDEAAFRAAVERWAPGVLAPGARIHGSAHAP
jgi:hypothetical protein